MYQEVSLYWGINMVKNGQGEDKLVKVISYILAIVFLIVFFLMVGVLIYEWFGS